MNNGVLVVEDNDAIRSLIVDTLTIGGYEVLQASDGATGVMVAHSARPSLILMDLMMPVLDGISAIQMLKNNPDTRRIRTIAMSVSTDLLSRRDDLPADGFLAKPFDIDHLLALVATHARRSGTAPLASA
ncbi:MAG TPA: response regulator [Thermomicrobiales bacterium]|nr:response regulator [Thermomicrobiales bacterium]